jgi:hypothetical protein
MRLLASAMLAAAGLGTAAAVALVARKADQPSHPPVVAAAARPAATTPTRTVVVVRQAPSPPTHPKHAKGKPKRRPKPGHGPGKRGHHGLPRTRVMDAPPARHP